jgi:hypothetical protein
MKVKPGRQHFGDSEVSDFDESVLGEKDVCGLQISMENVVFVHVANRRNHLVQNLHDVALLKLSKKQSIKAIKTVKNNHDNVTDTI